MVVITNNGRVIRKSRNLRGLITHSGVNLIKQVRIREITDGAGALFVLFENGDYCETYFVSYAVMCHFLANRRNMEGAPLVVISTYSGDCNEGTISRQNDYLVKCGSW
jgi:hypothetical protein